MSQRGRGFHAEGIGWSRLAGVAGLGLALLLPACNKTTHPTPVATPTPAPAKAVVSIALLNLQLRGSCAIFPSPCIPTDKNYTGYANELVYTLHVVESGGVGCNLNFVRLEVFQPDGTFLERTEQGPSVFAGGNRLDAGHTRDFTVISGFNSDFIYHHIYLVVSLGTTDDNGNVQISLTGHLDI